MKPVLFVLVLTSAVSTDIAYPRQMERCHRYRRYNEELPKNTLCSTWNTLGARQTTLCRRSDSGVDFNVIVGEMDVDQYNYKGFSALVKGRPKGIFLEFGCNIGVAAVALATLVPEVIIHCFEPVPETCAYADANVRKNNLQDRIVVHCCGGAVEDGSAVFWYDKATPGTTTHAQEGFEWKQKLKVEATLIGVANMVRSLLDSTSMDMIGSKIDCEGCEGIVAPILEKMMDYEPRLDTPFMAGEYHKDLITYANAHVYLLPGWTPEMMERFMCHFSRRRITPFAHCEKVKYINEPYWGSLVNRDPPPGIPVLSDPVLDQCKYTREGESGAPMKKIPSPFGNISVYGRERRGLEINYVYRTVTAWSNDLRARRKRGQSGRRGIVVVIGCGSGLEAVLFALADEGVTVHCFEKLHARCQEASQTISQNGLAERVVVHCCQLVEHKTAATSPSENARFSAEIVSAAAMRALLTSLPVEVYGKVEAVYTDCGGCEAALMPSLELMRMDWRFNTDYFFGVMHGQRMKRHLPMGWTMVMATKVICNSVVPRKISYLNCRVENSRRERLQ